MKSNHISVKVIKEVSQSVCQVNLRNNEKASGFLGKFSCNNAFVHGFFTNNHVINEEMLADCDQYVDLYFESAKKLIGFRWQNRFRFTCPVLDVTFILIDDLVTDFCSEFQCSFLNVCTSLVEKEDQFLVMQNPGGFSGTQVTSGTFYKMHSFDIFHKASTHHGSSGSPVMRYNGEVVGVHKRMAAQDADEYNIAVSANAVLAAICKFKTLPQKLISNPRNLDTHYENQIFQLGLTRRKVYRNYGVIYVSLATLNSVSGKRNPPIWFVPTIHG